MAASGEGAGLPRGGLSHSALSWPPASETGWRGRGPGASRPGLGRRGPPTFLLSVVVSESFLPPTSQGRGSGDCLGLPGPLWICGRSSVSSVPQWSVIRCRPAGLSLPPLSPLGGHCEQRPVDPRMGQLLSVHRAWVGHRLSPTFAPHVTRGPHLPSLRRSRASLCAAARAHPVPTPCLALLESSACRGFLSPLSPDPAELLWGGGPSPPGLRPQRSAGSEWRELLCTWHRPASTRPLAGPSVRKPGGRHRSGDGTLSPRLRAQCSQASPASAPPCLDIFQMLC